LKQQFRLSKGELPDLAELIDSLGLRPYFSGEVTRFGCDPVLASPHRLGESVSAALLLSGVAVAAIWKHRTGRENDLEIDIHDAIHYLHPVHFIWQQGYSMDLGANKVQINYCYQCKDDRHVWIQAGPPYPKLQNGYLNFFDCGNNRQAIQREIRQWNAIELEETLVELGLPCCVVRDTAEWRQHPQGKRLVQTPTIEIEKVADGEPTGLEPGAATPLAGIDILDFTHVLAGPRSTMSLAEFGANVLHIASPHHLDPKTINLGVNRGKKSAFLDLKDSKDLLQMRSLLGQADVFAFSYRPTVADRFGLTVKDILALNHKGIVCLSIDAFGYDGPWKSRPGFDQNAQMVSGFSVTEGSMEKPKTSPVYYINDLLTAYFAAAGMMVALLRRATEGGSYHVKVSLVRSCMWVQDLGLLTPEQYQSAPPADIFPDRLTKDPSAFTFLPTLVNETSPFGTLTRLAPAVKYSDLPAIDLLPVVPYGSCPPVF
jgi:crotonobetainyl-CoA:carnitine CoA-transferase CaiB-like acyl-CoA transferase